MWAFSHKYQAMSVRNQSAILQYLTYLMTHPFFRILISMIRASHFLHLIFLGTSRELGTSKKSGSNPMSF